MINLNFEAVEELEKLVQEGYLLETLEDSRCARLKNPEGRTILEVLEQGDKILILRPDQFFYGREVYGVKKYYREHENIIILFYADCSGNYRHKVIEVEKY